LYGINFVPQHNFRERAVPWETSPNAWRANVLSIKMYNSLRPVPGLRNAQLNELLELELCAEKNLSLKTPSVTPTIEVLSDDEMSELIALRKETKLCLSSVSSINILHQPSSIHLIPAVTALVDSPLGLGIHPPVHTDSVAYIRTGRCLIQLAAAATLSSQNPTIYAILTETRPGRPGSGGITR